MTAIRDHWEDKVLAEGYDARPIPVAVHLSFGLHFLERLTRVSEGIDT